MANEGGRDAIAMAMMANAPMAPAPPTAPTPFGFAPQQAVAFATPQEGLEDAFGQLGYGPFGAPVGMPSPAQNAIDQAIGPQVQPTAPEEAFSTPPGLNPNSVTPTFSPMGYLGLPDPVQVQDPNTFNEIDQAYADPVNDPNSVTPTFGPYGQPTQEAPEAPDANAVNSPNAMTPAFGPLGLYGDPAAMYGSPTADDTGLGFGPSEGEGDGEGDGGGGEGGDD